VWAATARGLSRFKDGVFKTLTKAEGLEDEVVYQLLDDGAGHLWLGCNTGLYRARKDRLAACLEGRARRIFPLGFKREDGLANVEFKAGSGANFKGRDGKLYFLTVKDLAVIDPARIVEEPALPLVDIQEVVADGTPLAQARAANQQRAATVRPGTTRVEFHYAGLSFTAPEQVQYQYKLDGYDNEWVEARHERTAVYTRISPGRYEFRVRAANKAGVWNESKTALALIVQPQVWQTVWFKTFCAAALFAAAFAFYRFRMARLEMRRAEQQAFSRKLIEAEEEERKRIAGELHDSLSQELQLIRNRAQMALNFMQPSAELSEQLKEISDGSNKAVAETRIISYALRPPELEHFGLTRALELLVERVGNASGFEASSELDNIDDVLTKKMEINFYRIIQESLNNVVKHARATRVIVTVKRNGSAIEASVFDNGVGFPTDAARTGGLGLSGIKERAQMLGGRMEIHSAIGKGTRIDIVVPAK
jgi:signal transduction histidine kinase